MPHKSTVLTTLILVFGPMIRSSAAATLTPSTAAGSSASSLIVMGGALALAALTAGFVL